MANFEPADMVEQIQHRVEQLQAQEANPAADRVPAQQEAEQIQQPAPQPVQQPAPQPAQRPVYVQPQPQQPAAAAHAGAYRQPPVYPGNPYGAYQAYNAYPPHPAYPPQPGYQPYRQPQQPYQMPVQPPVAVPPQQPVQQPAQPAPEEKDGKPQKRSRKQVFKTVMLIVVAVALMLTCSGVTAGLVSLSWNDRYDTMMDYMDDKVEALEDQIAEMDQQPGTGGGVLETPGSTLTPSQIYQQNLSSVVALNCTVTTTSNGSQVTGISSGTGFVITEDGYIVTNHHVINGASEITVIMADGTKYTAELIGSDSINDVALLKVEATGMNPVTIGNSSDVLVGDQVVAIGNALGEFASSLTVGYVSGMDRNVSTDGTVMNMLQTDVAINSGNSGGPLFNAKGEVIGITTAKYSGTTSSGASIEGIGFAIPIDDVMGLLDDLKEYGFVKTAYLGVRAQDVDSATADYYGFPVGVYVASVESGGCAAEAGLQAKDIIMELGGYEITCLSDLSRALRKFEAGETITMKIWRGGRELLLSVTLDERPVE